MSEKSKRGFGRMSPEKQRAIASKGGKASHRKGVAHEFTLEEARKAGHLGGKVIGANREHMAAIGRKGGQRTASTHRVSAAARRQETSNQQFAPSASPRASDLLRMDHRTVKDLFLQLEMTVEATETQVTLVQQVCTELEIHARLEEEIFYPAVKAAVNDEKQKKIEEGIEEHRRIKELIPQLRNLGASDASFLPTVEQLRGWVEHHVQEEEQEILPVAEEQLREGIFQLGRQMQQRRQELAGLAVKGHQLIEALKQETSPPAPLPKEHNENGQETMTEPSSQNAYSSETSQ